MYLVTTLHHNNWLKMLQRHSFWLALGLHMLALLTATIVLINPHVPEPRPEVNIPSYVYHETLQAPAEKSQPKSNPPQPQNGFEKPQPNEPEQTQEGNTTSQMQVINISKPSEPVHLIGDKTIDAPLLTLIGKALTRQLIYPKIALDFNIRGTPLIGFLLHPDGTISDVQLVRSSGAGVLDSEAIRAALSISPLKHVNAYLQEPKYLVIGIIFG